MSDPWLRRLQRLPAADLASWEPQVYDAAVAADADALARLADDGAVIHLHDTLRQQIVDLLKTRDPAEEPGKEELERQVEAHLAGVPLHRYGRWVYYPWSRRLVHVLAEAEFRELRTSRNRNKITFEEQEILRELRIGIVGMSIGNAAALTLVMEEVGGVLHLADFDRLDLSNTNRIRAGVPSLGVLKAVLTAREIYEINPYAKVVLFPSGVHEGNLEEFLVGGPHGPLHLVYEECDDLQMKVLVRERCRAHRIPVLMETSDRGLMDIERFDREPDRPLFHGLSGQVRAAELKGLSTYAKVPIVLKIMDMQGVSERLAASMVDIETTLASWPQLASEVALGAGINVDTARRVALGQLTQSGRFYVDLQELISDARAEPVPLPPEYTVEVSLEAQRIDLPPLTPVGHRITRGDITTLLAYVTTAFSGGNCQPWRFQYHEGRLRCFHDVERSRSFLDHRHHASHLAFGSLAENLALVAPALGLSVELVWAPVPGDELVVFDGLLRKASGPVAVDRLVEHIGARVTNRRLGPRVPLSPEVRAAIVRAAEARGARLQLLETPTQLDAVTGVIGRSDLVRLLNPTMHEEMMRELRWTREETERTRDGLDVATMEMTATDLAGLRMVSRWRIMNMVGTVGGGWGLQRPTKKALAAASAVGLITVPGTDARAYFEGGRATHRVWLELTAHGYAFQPMTPITYMFDRLLRGGGEGFTADDLRRLQAIRHDYLQLFEVPDGWAEPMLFRAARVGPPTARALRRRVEDIVTFTPFAGGAS